MINKIKQIINEDYNRLVSIRRDIHSHPELGFEEYRTQQLIINELEKLNCFEIKKSAKTGVVALIKGNIETENPKCVGIRADIDALPIDDVKEVEYKSLNKGLSATLLIAISGDAELIPSTIDLLKAPGLFSTIFLMLSSTPFAFISPRQIYLMGA